MTILTPSKVIRAAAILACSLPMISCAHSTAKTKSLAKAKTAVPTNQQKHTAGAAASQKGIASVYNDTRTASGERFQAGALCAAHRTLPLGTKVRVTNVKTGRSAIVRINDRGPYAKGRIIDLTPAAAAEIGLTRAQGIGAVEIAQVTETVQGS